MGVVNDTIIYIHLDVCLYLGLELFGNSVRNDIVSLVVLLDPVFGHSMQSLDF
jgi:hypothetical protein